LLGHQGPLEFTQDAEGLKVKMPADRPCDYAFALKITGLKLPGGNRLMTCKPKFKPGNKTENQTCHPNIV
jgi:hypothetical protein